jgi:hypothetical protein
MQPTPQQNQTAANTTCHLRIVDRSMDYAATVQDMRTYVLGQIYKLYKRVGQDECYIAGSHFESDVYIGIGFISFVGLNAFVFVCIMGFRRQNKVRGNSTDDTIDKTVTDEESDAIEIRVS